MKKTLFTVALASMLLVGMLAGTALADPEGWTGNPGSTYDGGVVTLDNTQAPTSYENPNLDVAVANGDVITFEYRVLNADGSISGNDACVAGTPRIFIQGGAYNTHDGRTNAGETCEQRTGDADAEGWRTVTGTVSGITDGTAGHTGIVNDHQLNPRIIEVRNIEVNGANIFAPATAEQCKNGGWELGDYKNQGECVSSFATARNA